MPPRSRAGQGSSARAASGGNASAQTSGSAIRLAGTAAPRLTPKSRIETNLVATLVAREPAGFVERAVRLPLCAGLERDLEATFGSRVRLRVLHERRADALAAMARRADHVLDDAERPAGSS